MVHRINRVTRISRATARAPRIRNRLRASFHASAARRATGHHRRTREK